MLSIDVERDLFVVREVRMHAAVSSYVSLDLWNDKLSLMSYPFVHCRLRFLVLCKTPTNRPRQFR